MEKHWAGSGRLLVMSALAAAVAAPAGAQNPLRRFTDSPDDTNRSNRVIYLPLLWAFPGPPPGRPTRSTSAAMWYDAGPAARSLKPDRVQDGAKYTLDRLEVLPAEGTSPEEVEVVITRRPAPPEGAPPPVLELVRKGPGISSFHDSPTVNRLPDGASYTFLARQPLWAAAGEYNTGASRAVPQYEVRLLPSWRVAPPAELRRAPTFGGFDLETRMALPPPRLPREEREARKRTR